MGAEAPTPRGRGVSPPGAKGAAGATRPRTPRFRSCGGCPPPRPGCFGGYTPPYPAVHFWTPKSEPKNRQNQGFGFLCLIGLYQIWNISAPNQFFHLIYSLVVNDTSATALLKGDMFLGVLGKTTFLGRTLGSIQRNSGQVSSMRGFPKGGLRPPLCRRGGGVHRGGTPSKGSRPYACFCLLFSREKSRSGSGGETPETPGVRGRRPRKGQGVGLKPPHQ